MDFRQEEFEKKIKNSSAYEKVKRNKDVVIVLGIFLIINLILINSFLKPFSKEVVDTSNFTEYYQSDEKNDLDDVFVVLSRNYYTIKKNYNLKDKSSITIEEDSKGINLEENSNVSQNNNKTETSKSEVLVEKQFYTVKEGDSLIKISEQFSQSLSVIKANNPKISPNLQIGQKVLVPTVNGIYYKIKNGDNLYDISVKYKVDIDVIRKYNKLENDVLQVGQELFLKDPNIKALANLGENFSMPIKYKGITSPYGNRFHPVLKRYILHSGVDMVAKYIPVSSSKSGTVIFAGVAGGYGNLVKIKHSDGYETRYAHLEKIYVKKGQKVNQGQIIGKSGMTGRVTGPHLHFEVRKDGRPVNPMRYIKR